MFCLYFWVNNLFWSIYRFVASYLSVWVWHYNIDGRSVWVRKKQGRLIVPMRNVDALLLPSHINRIILWWKMTRFLSDNDFSLTSLELLAETLHSLTDIFDLQEKRQDMDFTVSATFSWRFWSHYLTVNWWCYVVMTPLIKLIKFHGLKHPILQSINKTALMRQALCIIYEHKFSN